MSNRRFQIAKVRIWRDNGKFLAKIVFRRKITTFVELISIENRTQTMKKTLLFLLPMALLLASCEKEEDYSIPIDGDGNVYSTLQIGAYTWMGPLYTTSFNDGSPIAHDRTWSNAGSEAVYCCYNNNPDSVEIYGRLYNWFAASSKNIAPKGWHVATEAEWSSLVEQFGDGGWGEVAIALKATKRWEYFSDDVYATNESGLGMLPSGCRENYRDSVMHDAEFHDFGKMGYWWTSTQSIMGNSGKMMTLSYRNNELFGHDAAPDFGAAIFCVKNR